MLMELMMSLMNCMNGNDSMMNSEAVTYEVISSDDEDVKEELCILMNLLECLLMDLKYLKINEINESQKTK